MKYTTKYKSLNEISLSAQDWIQPISLCVVSLGLIVWFGLRRGPDPLPNLTQRRHGDEQFISERSIHETIMWVSHRLAGPEEAQLRVTPNTTVCP